MQEDPPHSGRARAPGRQADTGPAPQCYLTLITSPITGPGEASLGPRQPLGGAPPGSSAPLGLSSLGLTGAAPPPGPMALPSAPPRAREPWSTHNNTQGLPDVHPQCTPGPHPSMALPRCSRTTLGTSPWARGPDAPSGQGQGCCRGTARPGHAHSTEWARAERAHTTSCSDGLSHQRG